MVKSRCSKTTEYQNMSNHFIAHIIRDVFQKTNFTIYYGLDINFVKTLRTSEHGIGALHLFSDINIDTLEDSIYWNIGVDSIVFGKNLCDLFLSFDYNPFSDDFQKIIFTETISEVMKPGGLLLVSELMDLFENDKFTKRFDIINEIKRYKLFSDKEIYVYESI